MSLATIAPWAKVTLAGTRYPEGSYSDGVFVPGSGSPLSIEAAVWQAEERHSNVLPEGNRISEARVIRTATQLLVAGEVGEGSGGDVLVIDGEDFEVIDVKKRLDFYEAVAVRA